MLLVGCVADIDEKSIAAGDTTSSEKILTDAEYSEQGTLIVRFAPNAESRLATRSGATRSGIEGVDALLDEVSGYAVEPVFNITDKNREKVYSRGLHLWYSLHFSQECDIEQVAAKLAEVAEVERVQYSQRVCRLNNPQTTAPIAQRLSAEATRANNTPFNDKYQKYQWSLNNLGSDAKTYPDHSWKGLHDVVAGADINVLPAWELTKGDPSIVVAVVDEGVMYSHEDLSANMWVNSGEVEDDGVDNDGNGYIDDIHGFNFVRLDNNIKWNNANDSGHGTHVAGIIAAMNNNNIGICGIAGGSGNNDGVRIMTIQIFYGNGGASDRNMAKAIQYAADNGAHILQNSWGYPSHLSSTASPANDIAYKRALRVEAEAIDYFVANGGDESGPLEGGLAIFAAGNDGVSLPGYPAAYEPCVAVASLSPSLRPAYYTCYGIGTDIAAPGGEALYVNGAILSTVPDEFQDPSIQHYAMMQGTSQACPHVSGVAALGLSYAKKLGKRYKADEFRTMLLSATNDVEPYLTGSVVINNKTNYYSNYRGKLGAGYVDAYKLMLQIDGTPFSITATGASEVDLTPYFGNGVANAKLHEVTLSDGDAAAIGWNAEECSLEKGKLKVSCSKSGSATITVTLLVGGGSLDDNKFPYPTKVSKTFVLMTKSGHASNNGWL
jgi:subtilisin family serine protease